MTVEQAKEMFRELQKFRFSQSDYKYFAEIARKARYEGFEQSKDPEGNPWKPLKPATILRKQGAHRSTVVRRNKGGISGLGQSKGKRKSIKPEWPLIDRGFLRDAVSGATSTHGYVKLARSRSEQVYPGKSISDFHNEGTNTIPKREHWGIYKDARAEIIKEAESVHEKFVKSVIRKYANR